MRTLRRTDASLTPFAMARPRFLPDNFTLALIATVLLASLLPCRGEGAMAFNILTNIAVGLLFFLHGVKLSREAIIAGATHWRLHTLVFCCTFVMFPLLGLLLRPVLSPLVTPALYGGVIFLCTLPSTVQSSIAFTSMARGNVPAAVCSASASSLLGIFITPLLVGLIAGTAQGEHGVSFDAVRAIVLQLLAPFIAGQLLRGWLGGWMERRRALLRYVDQGSILLVVYTAFSAAVVEGLWHTVSIGSLGGLLVINIVLLGIALGITAWVSKRLGFPLADRITIIFCGSKKSLASGVPLAKVLFASHAVGAIVLPLMLFHQVQLMICAFMAQRWSRRPPDAAETAAPGEGLA
jgi:sodium/bile acid cotransporter 7